jgi:hypothetical protein
LLSKPYEYWHWLDHTATYSEFKKEMWANSAMVKHKIQIPVIVFTLARKKLFLRWVLERFKRSKIVGKRNPTE